MCQPYTHGWPRLVVIIYVAGEINELEISEVDDGIRATALERATPSESWVASCTRSRTRPSSRVFRIFFLLVALLHQQSARNPPFSRAISMYEYFSRTHFSHVPEQVPTAIIIVVRIRFLFIEGLLLHHQHWSA